MSVQQRLYYSSPIWVQNLAVSAYGYYLKRRRYGSGFDAIAREIEQSRTWNPEQVTGYQQAALISVLDRCFDTVPYYREIFRAHGITRTSIASPADLARLPLLSKDVVRQRGSDLVSTGSTLYWTQHTSGSTGTPVDVHLNQQTYQLVHGLLADFEWRNGVARHDLRATFAGRMTQPVDRMTPPFWRYNHAERQLLFSSYHLNDATLPFYIDELARRRPVEIIGYPSAISIVAEHLVRHQLAGKVTPRVVITNSETLLEWQRSLIEKAFACPVRDYYGSAEAVIFAEQCAQRNYHVHPLLGLAELVDDAGRPSSEGTLVCTTLINTTMPLVRYQIGDSAVRLTEPCPCGCRWPAFSHILGRVDDVIVTPDGRRIGRIDHIFKGLQGIRECQVIQEDERRVRLKMVSADDFRQTELLLANIRERLGADMEVTLEFVDSIARTKSGKFRGVVNQLLQAAPADRTNKSTSVRNVSTNGGGSIC